MLTKMFSWELTHEFCIIIVTFYKSKIISKQKVFLKISTYYYICHYKRLQFRLCEKDTRRPMGNYAHMKNTYKNKGEIDI